MPMRSAAIVVDEDFAFVVSVEVADGVLLAATVSLLVFVPVVVLLLAAGLEDAVELLAVPGVELAKVESVVLVEPDALPDVLAVASSDFAVSVDADVLAGEALVELA